MSTFIERIMGKAAGEVVMLSPDYLVINDGVSHAAVDRISTVANQDKVWVIYDHDVPTGSPEAAAVLRKNLKFAIKNGCHYIQAQGIGYQYMLDEIVKPGQIVIGGGSHGSIFGAKGALGINVSIPELARAVETGRYSTIVPETIFISVSGELREGTSILDGALVFLKENTGIAGKAIEFYCPSLSDHEKAVLCSMACISGAYTAFATDEKKDNGWPLFLDKVKPMVMMPCESLDKQREAEIIEKAFLNGMEFHAGQIGGFTGGTIEELRKAADLIEGRTLALGFRLTICPATSQDYLKAMEEGIITKFINYGAQISAAGDHSVVLQGAGAMGHGEKLLTTGLYTFSGAMGCEDAEIYTASAESVIAASTTKKI